MEIKIEIPKYTKEAGFKFEWEDGFSIETKYENGLFSIVANREGLISLGKLFFALAQEEIPAGYHLHLDENNSLETGSKEIIIEKN